MSTLVSIRNLHKTYQRGPEKVDVLHGIDIDIEQGDFVALMGPSGSGKTTLLNLIGGLDTPTSGSIEIAGQRIDGMKSGQLSQWRSNHVGFVFQICDEPTGDLDRASAEEILTLLQTLNREHGKTIVMVTHDPKAAEYATHTLHLDKGNLVEHTAHAA